MEKKKHVIDILTSYNWTLIPLKGKQPFIADWQNLRRSHPDAINADAACNIGVVLGNASGGLVDVDIDRKSALSLACAFLPRTGMVFGRKSKRRSHYLYTCEDAGSCKKWQDEKGVVVELRANGGQTMVPPSIHPCGERVRIRRG